MMAKDKKKPKRTSIMQAISMEMSRMLLTIGVQRGESIRETLDRVAKAVIVKEYRKVLDEMHGQVTGEAEA
jgi:hypothetical protein